MEIKHKIRRDQNMKNMFLTLAHLVCSQHSHGAKEQGRLDIPIIFPLLPQSTEKASKNYVCHLTSSQKEEKWNWKIKIPSRCCCERSGFFCVDLSVPMRRKELT